MATVKSGYLQKLSGFFKRDWKRRYFVLYHDGEMVYYERAGAEESDGRVNIRRNCQRIDYGYEVESDLQHKAVGRISCLFSIHTSEKNVTLLADTEQEAREWVQKLNEIRYNTKAAGNFIAPVPPANTYPSQQPGIAYPMSNPPGLSYPNQPTSSPYPQNASPMHYPSPHPTAPPNPTSMPPQPRMSQPYPTATTYPPPAAPYNQPMYAQYPGYPAYRPTGNYPVYQQQQQVPQSKSKSSSKKGLLAGAAGGALAGGLLGFGMGHAVGGLGDSFDFSDSDSD